MHEFFGMLAEGLNNAGLDMKATLKPSASIPWTPENVKNHLWRPIQEVYIGKESTTSLETSEVSEIYTILMRHLSEKFGVYVEFPSNR